MHNLIDNNRHSTHINSQETEKQQFKIYKL